jgi:hypothetical protein
MTRSAMRRGWRRATPVIVALLVAGCSTSNATITAPAVSATPASATAATTAAATATLPAATGTPTATASPTAAPSPSPAVWVGAGSIDPGRAYTHAVILTGGDVLVVGDDWTGCGGEGPTAMTTSVNAEVYRAASSTWQAAASLNAIRSGLTAVPLSNGGAMVAGGYTEDGIGFSSVKIFDPVALSWSQPGLMTYARVNPSSVLLEDGRVLVTGGWFPSSTRATMVATTEVFDPATSKWSASGRLHMARHSAPAVTLADGRVLVAGGYMNLDAAITRAVEVWNPATGAWTLTGSLPSTYGAVWPGATMVALADGSALLIGGTNNAATSAQRWDPATGQWTATIHMVTAVAQRAMAVLADGRVLAAGGMTSRGAVVTAAELYDPGAGTWTATVPMPSVRAAGVAALLPNGSVLVAGGITGVKPPPKGVTGAGGPCPIPIKPALRYIPAVP